MRRPRPHKSRGVKDIKLLYFHRCPSIFSQASRDTNASKVLKNWTIDRKSSAAAEQWGSVFTHDRRNIPFSASHVLGNDFLFWGTRIWFSWKSTQNKWNICRFAHYYYPLLGIHTSCSYGQLLVLSLYKVRKKRRHDRANKLKAT